MPNQPAGGGTAASSGSSAPGYGNTTAGTTTSTTSTSTAPTSYTAQTFAIALLKGLGYATTATNIQALVAWMSAEGGHWNNTAWYNPLNSTLKMAGSTTIPGNSSGVQAYTSWQEGLQATINTLRNGDYGGILAALKQGTSAGAVAQAVVNSPWGTKSINLDANNSDYGTVTRNPETQGVYGNALNPTDTAQLNEAQFLQGLDASGYPKALIDSNPELKKIFSTAIQQKWWLTSAGQDRFLAAIKSTSWWKKTTDSQRRMEALQIEDPREYQRELTQKLADVRSLSIQLGIGLSPSELNAVAQRSLVFGLDDNEMNALFASHIKFKQGQQLTGQVGLDANTIQQMASSYYVTLGDGTITNLLQNLVTGSMNPTALTDYFKELAISKFPHLTKQLNAGQTVADVADPYKQEMAKIMEQDPNGIAPDNPNIMKALQQPTGTGDFQLMPLYQFDSMLKQDPAWLKTNNARDSMMDAGTGLLRSMGLIQ